MRFALKAVLGTLCLLGVIAFVMVAPSIPGLPGGEVSTQTTATTSSGGTIVPSSQPRLPTTFQFQTGGYVGGSYSYYKLEEFNTLDSSFWIWRGDVAVSNGICTTTNGWLQSKSKYTGRILTFNMLIAPPAVRRYDPLIFGFSDDFMKTFAAFVVDNNQLYTFTGTMGVMERSSGSWDIPSGWNTYSIQIYQMLGRRVDFMINGNVIASHTHAIPTTFMYVFIGAYQCSIQIEDIELQPRTYFGRTKYGFSYHVTTTTSIPTYTVTASVATTSSEHEEHALNATIR